MMSKPLKMYIFVRKSLPSHKVISVAHGVLIAHLKFSPLTPLVYSNENQRVYNEWLNTSFRKVVCEVTDAEFTELKKESDYITVTESALPGEELTLVFCPRYEWPVKFKTYPLFNT
jgi:peptidyl-tRNA hydrolase